ncbi:hypothetical protein TD95_002651 [Thielaviopsis punctulata]|uniref:tRNA-intron lyase n=1 Tax=Thielaviopsis punctulata TaxID=72032 RepID=A0A0F4Z827_9PEZI|nr:hypothetical protein TD95_002651 [Thielaviopsis punctulata]
MSSTAEPLDKAAGPSSSNAGAQKPRRTIHEIYAQPTPVKVFSLPTFQPSNPLSVVQLLYTWISQSLFPPEEALKIYEGLFSPQSKSVQVINEDDMFGLWQQGFFGKGNLSRSEPNWAKSQEVKKGLKSEHVSEAFTVLRREQRKEAKWERARAEQEAINATRLKEALQKFDESLVGHSPLALVKLPDSYADLDMRRKTLEQSVIASQREYFKSFGLVGEGSEQTEAPLNHSESPGDQSFGQSAGQSEAPKKNIVENKPEQAPANAEAAINLVPHSPLALLKLPNSQADLDALLAKNTKARKKNNKPSVKFLADLPSPPLSTTGEECSDSQANDISGKPHKTVRFSQQVEATTYPASSPPSPTRVEAYSTPLSVTARDLGPAHKVLVPEDEPQLPAEHLQLTFEEAFFLSFGLGRLRVVNPTSKKPYSNGELFRLFREYAQPAGTRLSPELRPDDSFLVNYVVYHHFRSLGFVPRPGMKFGVDWLLYLRGPVFDHAEYGMILVPSYTSSEWKQAGVEAEERSWQWFHGVNRTLAHAFKTFVLVYVDVPGPKEFAAAEKKGVAAVLKRYRVREFIVKRWSANRNR